MKRLLSITFCLLFSASSLIAAQDSVRIRITNNLGISTEELMKKESFKTNVQIALAFIKKQKRQDELKGRLPYNYEEHTEHITVAFRTKEKQTKNNMIIVKIDIKTKKPTLVGIK